MASSWKGSRKWHRRLRKTPKSIRKETNLAIGVSAEELAAAQRSVAPKDKGDLAKSIVATPPGQTPPAYSQGQGKKVLPNQWVVSAGNTKVRYAHLVEFGSAPHVNKGKFKGTRHPGTSPQPFFFPIYRSMKSRIKGRVTRSINKAIKATR